MEKNTLGQTKSDLNLANRTNLSITGIKKIRSTDPAQVIADLDNCTIIVAGSNLSVQAASVSSGTLEIAGLISSIKYVNSKNSQGRWSMKNIFR